MEKSIYSIGVAETFREFEKPASVGTAPMPSHAGAILVCFFIGI